MVVQKSLAPAGDYQCFYDGKTKIIGTVKDKELKIMIIICFLLSDFYSLAFICILLTYPQDFPVNINDQPQD